MRCAVTLLTALAFSCGEEAPSLMGQPVSEPDMGSNDAGDLPQSPARLVPPDELPFGALQEGLEKELFLRFINRNELSLRIERPLAG